MNFYNDIKMDFKGMFDSDDVDLFEKYGNLTPSERLMLAEFVQSQINETEDDIAILSKNRMKGKKLPGHQASKKLILDNENKTLHDLQYTKRNYVRFYKELTDTNTDTGMQALSEQLSTLADHLLFTEEIREVCIETTKVKTVLLNMYNALQGRDRCVRFAGSKAEGTAALNAPTDTDLLVIDPLIRVYKASQNPETSLPYLRMVDDINTPSGYIKLQVFHNDHAVHRTRVKYYQPFFLHKLIIDKSRMFLSNEFTDEISKSLENMDTDKHGPAVTTKDSIITSSTDNVHAYICEALPDQVVPYFKRKRRYDWPSEETIKLFKKMGCVVVAIGHQNSPEQTLQWRLSFTNQEMYILHNFNMTQYKCYVILKYFNTFFIKDFNSDSLCSYHLKTVLFFTIENSNPIIWHPKYLAYVILKCLHNLRECVDEMNCPNYFIPKENMFEMKLNPLEKEKLNYFLSGQNDRLYNLRLLSYTRESKLPSKSDVLLARAYHITQMLNIKFFEVMKCMEKKGYPQNVLMIAKIIQCLEIFTEDNKSAICPSLSGYTAFPELLIFVLLIGRAGIPCLQKFCNDEMPTFKDIYPILINNSAVRSAFYHVKNFLHAQVVSIFLMSCRKLIKQNHSMPFEIINHQDQLAGTARFINTMLKQASILYIDGHHKLVDDSLKDAAKMKLSLPALPVACLHIAECIRIRVKSKTGTPFHVELLQKLKPNQENLDYLIIHTLTCLQFDSTETLMAPIHLQYEAFRTIGAPIPRSKDLNYITIDPFVFLHFLWYMNYEAMNDKPRKNLELHSLENILFYNLHKTKPKHFDTALNCLGHIYVTKGWHRLAMNCFRKSMDEESLNNAAKFHIMFLLFG